MSMVEWGVIGLSAVGAYKGVKGKAPALRNTFSKAKISELFGLSRTKKTGATASASETNASVEMLEKTFTKAEMKELLASKANDNFSSINDNGICMSKGKVVNGESVGVGRVSSVFSEVNYKGGSYGGIKVKTKPHNIERHHIPPDSVTDVSKKKGMSIQMEQEDHWNTSSWGSSKEAKKYRENLQSMISEGKIRDAVATDVWDVTQILDKED